MENKDIEKAAREYAEDRYRYCCDDLGEPIPEDVDLRLTSYESDYNSFIAGAQMGAASRQFEIDELIEAVEEATRWVPIEERLPEVGREVLGCHPDWVNDDDNPEGICLCFWFEGTRGVRWLSSEWDTDQDAWDAVGGQAPTHWMPKPPIHSKATQLLEKYGKK